MDSKGLAETGIEHCTDRPLTIPAQSFRFATGLPCFRRMFTGRQRAFRFGHFRDAVRTMDEL